MCSSAGGCPAEVSLSKALKPRQHRERRNLDFFTSDLVVEGEEVKTEDFPLESGEEFSRYPE